MSEAEKRSKICDMMRPPVNRAMRVLDRSFFQKSIPLSAARVLEKNQIHSCRSLLKHDLLKVEHLQIIRPDPSDQGREQGRKALLLQPEVHPQDSGSWSPTLRALVDEGRVSVFPYKLELTYDDWSYHDILTSILPEAELEDLPSGFSVVGHVAHLNLRSPFLPYKHLIAEVLLDKNPPVRTVINKINDVGAHNEFRTFQYELLAGDPSLQVQVKQQDCVFRFDYSKVYWNSRLSSEHERIVSKFNPGEAVCDVMAGVGPFAVPAGKKKVFVWANDLNPDSFTSLVAAMRSNHVSEFVQVFHQDGREFIKRSVADLLKQNQKVDVSPKPKKVSQSTVTKSPLEQIFLDQPKTFNHYVMNLPASATTFLDAFVGLYKGREYLFSPSTSKLLPMIHVYFFSTKNDDIRVATSEACEEISRRLEYRISPAEDELEVFDVRDVAPNKRMFCASFRLPKEVAFR